MSRWIRGYWAKADKLFLVLFVLLAGVYLYPFFAFRYLPMQDMPAHLAVVRIWSEAGSNSVLGQTYAARGSFSPYIVVYGLLRILSTVISVHLAGKIVLVGYALGLPLSVAYALRSFGRDPRYALLAFAFIFNRQFVLGYLSNLVAIPIFVVSIGLLKRYLDAPSLRREVTLGLLVLTLYFTHILGALSFAIAGPIVFFAQVWHPQQILRRSLFVLPSFGMAAWWSLRSSSGKGFVGQYSPFYTNLADLWHWALDVLRAEIDDLMLLTIVATVLLCAAIAPRRKDSVTHGFSLAAAGIGLLVAFFFLPSHTLQPIEHWGTGGRVVIPGFLLFLGLANTDVRGLRLVLLGPALALMLVGQAKLVSAMADFDRRARHFDPVIAAMPPDQRVMCLVYEKEHPAFEASPFWHFLLYYQVQKGGASSDGFVNEATPIAWRKGGLPGLNPHLARKSFNFATMGGHFDHFLVIWPENEIPQKSFWGAGDKVRLVAKSGQFAAYEKVGTR